jgi:hypothetical protein
MHQGGNKMNTNDLIIKLGENLETLTVQYTKCITTSNYNEALNIMKNIDMVVKQLKELDFQTFTSKYGTNDSETGEEIKELAIWKQNGFGQIKNHEVFKIIESGTISGANIKRCLNNEIHNDWYNILKFFIETKQSQLINLDYTNHENEMKHRGTGKTTAIVRLSSDYRIPIYSSKIHSALLKDIQKELNLDAVIIDDIKLLNMRQYSCKGIILVDELTDISKIDSEKFIIVGFTR